MTEAEETELNRIGTEEEWKAVCLKVKQARDDKYPPDWYAKVLAPGGILQKFVERTGVDGTIKVQTIP